MFNILRKTSSNVLTCRNCRKIRYKYILTILIFCIVTGCRKDKPSTAEATPENGNSSFNNAGITKTEHSIKDDFATLKTALMNSNPEVAADMVTEGTHEMYEKARKLALDSSGVDFESIDQVEVVLVFQLRFMIEKSRLMNMTGRDIFEYGVAEGLVKKDVLESMEINQVQYDGDNAFATITNNGQAENDILFKFHREDGNWKLDMVELIKLGNRAFDAIRESRGMSKTEMAIFLLENTYNEPIPPSILNGPIK